MFHVLPCIHVQFASGQFGKPLFHYMDIILIEIKPADPFIMFIADMRNICEGHSSGFIQNYMFTILIPVTNIILNPD
jgi:hypothetical protein